MRSGENDDLEVLTPAVLYPANQIGTPQLFPHGRCLKGRQPTAVGADPLWLCACRGSRRRL